MKITKETENAILNALEVCREQPSTPASADAIAYVLSATDGLVCAIIKKYYPTFIEQHFEDMKQEGLLSIYKNCMGHDISKGKFSTYIAFYVQHDISRYICSLNNSTPHYQASTKKYKRAVKTLSERGISAPTIAQIAEVMGVGREAATRAHNLYVSQTGTLSLDDEESTLKGISDFINPSTIVEDKMLNETLYQAIQKLAPDEKAVICEIFFSSDSQKKSLSNTADELGMSIDEVTRLKASAYRKLCNDKMLSGLVSSVQNDEIADYADSLFIDFSPAPSLLDDDLDTIFDFAVE